MLFPWGWFEEKNWLEWIALHLLGIVLLFSWMAMIGTITIVFTDYGRSDIARLVGSLMAAVAFALILVFAFEFLMFNLKD